MLLERFDPPGFLDDLSVAGKRMWSDFISEGIDKETKKIAGHHFYNPIRKETIDDMKQAEISWTAFPRIVSVHSASDKIRWQRADALRDVQDEYCEWSVTRDATSQNITAVTFTCEGPEYWHFLAQQDPGKALDLYRKFIDDKVKEEDLFSSGAYNPRNKWNNSTTMGAMHLIQDANTLGAEIDIAVRSSIVRKINGVILTGEQELIDCGRYGKPERNSDPHIGAVINSLARQDAQVTIANPVALYIRGLSTGGWQTPDGSDPQQYWKVIRGTAEQALRAVYEVPPSKGFTVSDITINGQPIKFGGQIADFITIKVVGQACDFGNNKIAPVSRCLPGGAIASAKVASVRDAIARPAIQEHR